ncbi:hypothetical protein DFJ73DRAFT_863939 [Zopfochytrium polystomum]|nr:hypothetical protein DFJ73DRAFT_863939 [Zopfochytrium polystomum]
MTMTMMMMTTTTHHGAGLRSLHPASCARIPVSPSLSLSSSSSSFSSSAAAASSSSSSSSSWSYVKPKRALTREDAHKRALDVLKTFAAENKRLDVDEAAGGTAFRDMQLDSLDVATITLMIEDEFGVEFSDADFAQVTNLQSAVDTVSS